jgi:hypothetical protein
MPEKTCRMELRSGSLVTVLEAPTVPELLQLKAATSGAEVPSVVDQTIATDVKIEPGRMYAMVDGKVTGPIDSIEVDAELLFTAALQCVQYLDLGGSNRIDSGSQLHRTLRDAVAYFQEVKKGEGSQNA